MGREFDPERMRLSEVQRLFRHLGLGITFSLAPSAESQEYARLLAVEAEARKLVDYLWHDRAHDDDRGCAICDLIKPLQELLATDAPADETDAPAETAAEDADPEAAPAGN